ncbi:MAG: response regulator transcription factor, partial [Actinomycetota bacterium]|nr:response regulator transcription factor [Actinomycetota bacterium]
KTRILLADDHLIVRQGLRLILDAAPDLAVVAEAADGADAVAQGLEHELDLAVLDVSMPRLTGLQATRHLLAHRPHLRVLILSMHDNEQFFLEALRAGASGYVLKTAADEDLVGACRAVMRGEPFLYPKVERELAHEYLERVRDGEAPANPLTPRESEVVKLIAEGFTSKEIADTLTISDKTVERHRANVLEKLGLRDRVALTRYAVRHGLVEP